MLRTTRHKVFHIPHGVALAAGLMALASWTWTTQDPHNGGGIMAAQEEMASSAAVDEGSKALLDLGLLLLLRSGGH